MAMLAAPFAACGGEPPSPSRETGAATPRALLGRLAAVTEAPGGADLVAFARLLDEPSRERFARMVAELVPVYLVTVGLAEGDDTRAGTWADRWQEALAAHGFGGASGDGSPPAPASEGKPPPRDPLGLLETLAGILEDTRGSKAGGDSPSPVFARALRVYRPDPASLVVAGEVATARGLDGGTLRLRRGEDGRWALVLGEVRAPVGAGR